MDKMRERDRIILVDDDMTILNIGKNTLIDKYDVFTIPSGEKLFKILERVKPKMILLDVEMPGLNGYEIIKKLKADPVTAPIPVIFLTAKSDSDSELIGLSLGAIDYISKPFSPPLLLKRIEVHLLVEEQKNELKDYNENLEQMVAEKTKTVLEMQNVVLKTMAELVECRDDVTGGHIERTTGYLRIMLDAMLEHDDYKHILSTWNIEQLVLSAQLHDVGKITIKDNILLKPAKLSVEEFTEMKKHTESGVQIIQKIKSTTDENAFLNYAEILSASHHEKWDGTGYPRGLKGEEIPLPGRLMAVVDVYDALTNERPYKKAFSHEVALEIIKADSGIYFDPKLVEVFIAHEQDFRMLNIGLSL
ncbi:MAG: response regulator [Clostridiales bacterium]|jgi:putative two-component system response regulator|nr:response regulator [Clostridiales bacterium]